MPSSIPPHSERTESEATVQQRLSRDPSASSAAPAAAEPPAAAPPGTSAASEASASHAGTLGLTSSSATLTLAVREEQAARGRGIVILAMVVAVVTLIAAQLPERESPGRWPASAILLLLIVGTGVLSWRFRGNRPVNQDQVFALGVLCIATVLAVIFYVGVFSPCLIALFVGVYFYGLSDSVDQGWAIYLFSAIGYGVLTVGATAGLLPIDRSVLALWKPEPLMLAAVAAVLEIFMGLVFWLARLSRRATLQAIDSLERAHRQIRQREALLDEARADLDRALDVGKIGRFTGKDLGGWIADEIVGRGAMGEVYRGRHRDTGADAALKVLHPYMLADEKQRQRFFREAEIAGSLDSPHIVRVLGSGTAVDGSPWLAMEMLEGKDLAWHLREERRLGPRQTLELVTQVATALGVAQEAGIVHRDVKPQNLMLKDERESGRVWKVLDFGVSKIAESAGTLTEGAAVGTPSYMSPEQARGKVVDHRADVFALGVIAYRCLTGRPAFTGSDGVATMYNVVHVQPARPGEILKLQPDIELALAIALAKDPARRFSSAPSFAAALRDAVRGELDERLCADAETLLVAHPWSTDDTELPKPVA